MFCKNCGAQLNENTNFCTYCGCPVKENTQQGAQYTPFNNGNYNQKQKGIIHEVREKNKQNQGKKKAKSGCLSAVIIFVSIAVIITVVSILVGGNDDTDNSNITSSTVAEANEDKQEEIFEDDYMKVTYIECFDKKSVDGATYLRLSVENKSDKNITVSLEDVSVNGAMVNTGSGVPMTIAPGKSSQQPFILFTGAAGIGSSDEIDSISLKISLLDNDTSEVIEETKQIEIDVK